MASQQEIFERAGLTGEPKCLPFEHEWSNWCPQYPKVKPLPGFRGVLTRYSLPEGCVWSPKGAYPHWVRVCHRCLYIDHTDIPISDPTPVW